MPLQITKGATLGERSSAPKIVTPHLQIRAIASLLTRITPLAA